MAAQRKLFICGLLGAALLAMLSCGSGPACAEDGYQAWLRYPPLTDTAQQEEYRRATGEIVVETSSPILSAARQELQRGCSGLLARQVPAATKVTRDGAIVLGTAATSPLVRAALSSRPPVKPATDGFIIRSARLGGKACTIIAGESERGVLYGAFALLRRMQLHQSLRDLDMRESPAFALRLVNHWDNLDGSIERGYAGRSIFRWDELPRLNARYRDYARLLASLGINGLCVNNVNASHGGNFRILTPEYIRKAAALAGAFRAYGVRLYFAVGFDSPRTIGRLKTADPLDLSVRKWWKDKADELYRLIPDFGGFVVKADSEGQPGPYVYGRTHADGANMMAQALKPHGGLVLWRSFVYHTAGGDRARMASDNFLPLDGKFADNALVQIKNGPIDFQVREPVHPLFGALPHTNTMMEMQIVQEYTGQDVDLCYLVPQWREVLHFDTHARGPGSTVRRVVDGSLFGQRNVGVAGVPNVGEDRNWLGHHLAMANFYGFGRLAWNPDLSAAEIAREWTRLTFGHDAMVVQTVTAMLLDSQAIYESYTSPLGLGVLHEGGAHFDPAPEMRYFYHHADRQGVGWDRSVASGSGFAGLYFPPVSAMYERVETTPDELLLFFHHVPYTYRLKSGQTVIQHIYDTHFEGVEGARRLRARWVSLKGRIDEERYAAVLERFDRQVEHAVLWRDRINLFFFQLSGIPDGKRRLRSDYRLYHKDEKNVP